MSTALSAALVQGPEAAGSDPAATALQPTPSELVLLHCDRFAPTGPLSLWARLQLRAQAALPWLASPRDVYVRPLRGDKLADREQLVSTVIAAALLADEQAGGSRLRLEGGHVVVEPLSPPVAWPKSCMEDRLRRGRALTVTEVVHDWLADGSNHPWHRALRLIEHSAVLRGLARQAPRSDQAVLSAPGSALGARAEIGASVQLLEDCRTRRPDLWAALQADIRSGVGLRWVAPGRKVMGTTEVPVDDYREAPIDALDGTAGAAAAERKPVVLRWPHLLVLALLAGLAALLLLRQDPAARDTAQWTSGLTALLLLLVTTRTRLAVRHHQRVRLRNGLPTLTPAELWQEMCRNMPVDAAASSPPGLADDLASGLFMTALVALLSLWSALVACVLIGALMLSQWVKLRGVLATLRAQAAVEAVKVRERAAGPEAGPEIGGSTGSPVPQPPSPRPQAPRPPPSASAPPWELRRALELPEPDRALQARLGRPEARWAAVRSQRTAALIALIAGHLIITLAVAAIQAWGGATLWPALWQALPATTLMALVLTGLARVKAFPVLTLLRAWQVLILLQSLLGLGMVWLLSSEPHDPWTAPVMLAFLALHGLATRLALRRTLAAWPLDWPARLALLRVFGSPTFDDLVALIEPWRSLGTIEHLEGFDTVGRNDEVLAALDAGDIDRALVKDTAQLLPQLDADLLALGPDLRFPRHAFQCTSASWRAAVAILLDRADAVVMDLTGLCPERQGCAWELRQLLYRVPLQRVTLLVNDSTDLDCLRGILEEAARALPPTSPNAADPAARWQLVHMGGLSERQPGESHDDWLRRSDQRLDPRQLTARLWRSAQPRRHSPPADAAPRLAAALRRRVPQ